MKASAFRFTWGLMLLLTFFATPVESVSAQCDSMSSAVTRRCHFATTVQPAGGEYVRIAAFASSAGGEWQIVVVNDDTGEAYVFPTTACTATTCLRVSLDGGAYYVPVDRVGIWRFEAQFYGGPSHTWSADACQTRYEGACIELQ